MLVKVAPVLGRFMQSVYHMFQDCFRATDTTRWLHIASNLTPNGMGKLATAKPQQNTTMCMIFGIQCASARNLITGEEESSHGLNMHDTRASGSSMPHLSRMHVYLAIRNIPLMCF